MRPTSSIPVGIALALVGAVSPACSLSDLLEGAPCNSSSDCASSQTCVRTLEQEAEPLDLNAAEPQSGVCSSDDACLRGEQAGCQAVEGSTPCPTAITSGLRETMYEGVLYCCPSGTGDLVRVYAVTDDAESAACVSCSSDDCGDPEEEACIAGDERCEVAEGALCGCRVRSDRLKNRPCSDDDQCGSEFTCVRTLEQEEEPDVSPGEGALEPGWCRPTENPTCDEGAQPGCTTPSSSCVDGVQVCSGNACYCCPLAGNPSSFEPRVYAVDTQGTAACVDCPRNLCGTGEELCTKQDDPGCVVDPGELCGCRPTG